jgi:hypothetical protein
MGDTVLFQDEVKLPMFVALESGLSVTALHDHFFFDHPKVFFMHIEGEGTLEHLASSVGPLYDKVRQFRAAHPTTVILFPRHPLPYDRQRTADYFLLLLGPWGSSPESYPKHSESFGCWNRDARKTSAQWEIRASASVTRRGATM